MLKFWLAVMQRIANARHLQLTNQWHIVVCVQTENQVNCMDQMSWQCTLCVSKPKPNLGGLQWNTEQGGSRSHRVASTSDSVTKLNRCHKTLNRCHKQREENWEWELGTNWDGEVKAATRETGSADDAGAGDILVPMPVLYNCVLSHLLINMGADHTGSNIFPQFDLWERFGWQCLHIFYPCLPHSVEATVLQWNLWPLLVCNTPHTSQRAPQYNCRNCKCCPISMVR